MAASFAQAFSQTGTGVNTITLSFTAAAGSNRKLLVACTWEGNQTFTSLTYAGSGTGVVSAGTQVTGASNDKIRRFYIDETTILSGSQDLILTLSGSSTGLKIMVMQCNDAAQGALDNQNTATPSGTTAIEASLTPTVDNCLCFVFAVAASGLKSSENAGQTNRISLGSGAPRAYASTEAQTTATADTFGYTWSANANAAVWVGSIAGAVGGPVIAVLDAPRRSQMMEA